MSPDSAQQFGSESQSQKSNADGAAVVGADDGPPAVGPAVVGETVVGASDGRAVVGETVVGASDGSRVGTAPTHVHHLA